MIYSPNNFQVYSTVLLTIVTMLCMNLLILKLISELTHLIAGSLRPLINLCPVPYL